MLPQAAPRKVPVSLPERPTMKQLLRKLQFPAILLFAALLAVACGRGQTNGDGNATPTGECFVHLYDGDNFDETDANYRLEQPGRYGDLSRLPGVDKNWDDEADSMRVGANAHVTAWSEPGFGGEAKEYPPGDYPDVEPEPRSLELTCS